MSEATVPVLRGTGVSMNSRGGIQTILKASNSTRNVKSSPVRYPRRRRISPRAGRRISAGLPVSFSRLFEKMR